MAPITGRAIEPDACFHEPRWPVSKGAHLTGGERIAAATEVGEQDSLDRPNLARLAALARGPLALAAEIDYRRTSAASSGASSFFDSAARNCKGEAAVVSGSISIVEPECGKTGGRCFTGRPALVIMEFLSNDTLRRFRWTFKSETSE